jgi:hypothetical protein
MLARVRAEAGDQVTGDAVSVLGHGCQNSGHISNVGQHARVGDEASIFELLLLLDRITALHHWPAEGDPIEEVVEGFDLGGFGTDGTADTRRGACAMSGGAWRAPALLPSRCRLNWRISSAERREVPGRPLC